MSNKIFITCLVLFGALVFSSCSKDEEVPAESTKTLSLNFTDLPVLGSDFVYEGWIIVNGSPISTGVFTTDNMGVPSKTSFSLSAINLDAASKFVLTIEPAIDPDPAPSKVHLLAGDFSSSTANLGISDGAALGTSFDSAAGKYIFATPTDGAMNNELSGVWFLDNSSGSPAKGLELPVLPEGWLYEGWSVINGMPVSTGKFNSVESEDMSAAFSSMMNPGPPFPGEDFLLNAPAGLSFPTDLSGSTTVISLEPDPDDSPAPFAIKPLLGTAPAMAMDHFVYDLNKNLGNIPSGTATK